MSMFAPDAAFNPTAAEHDVEIASRPVQLDEAADQLGRSAAVPPAVLSHRRLQVAVPCVVLFLTVSCWFGALLKSNFLSDDFFQLVTYSNLSHFLTLKYDQGQIPINVFWTVGYISFGTGSAIPYLLVNSGAFALGLFLWLRAGSARLWAGIQSWWIASFALASAAWMLIALWSANVTHSAALLALGTALLAHERAVRSTARRSLLLWSLIGALCFALVIASDPLYIGILPLAILCASEQLTLLRTLGSKWRLQAVLSWNVLLPLLYFFLIAYPEKSAVPAYAGSSIGYFARDWSFYIGQMAPTRVIEATYLAILLATGVASIWALRYRQFFAIACCLSAGLMGGIMLSERQQLSTNYTFVPFLLVLSACVAGWTTVFRHAGFGLVRRYWWVPPLTATVLVAVLFYSGGAIRSYFDATPYGTERGLVQLRDSVATLSSPGKPLCIVETMTRSDEAEFNAWIANGDAFLVDPVDAAYATVAGGQSTCPTGVPIVEVGVGRNGDFEVTGYKVEGS